MKLDLNSVHYQFVCQGQYARSCSFILFSQTTCLRNEVCWIVVFILERVWFMLRSDPWPPIKCDAEQCGSACFPYGNVDKSIWRTHPVHCRSCFFLLSLSVLESEMDLRLGAFFGSKRLIGPLCTSSNHHVLLMNFCLTESHILTRIIECALHLPMLCCAYWNVYCATVVWFCFLLLLYQWCLFVKCYGWKFDSHLLLDEWVTKQHGCKYFV